jgi:hypothetical protein
MKYETLGRIRYYVPGFMLCGLLWAVGFVTKWFELPVPTKVEELPGFGVAGVLAAALAFPYNALHIRDWLNRTYSDQVNRNLLNRLTGPFSGNPMIRKDLTWTDVDPVFWKFIESDRTLGHQASRAFRNGALWSSAADLRAISLLGLIIFILVLAINLLTGASYFSQQRELVATAVCGALIAFSYLFSMSLTGKQIAIGNEQVNRILTHHKDEWFNKLRHL